MRETNGRQDFLFSYSRFDGTSALKLATDLTLAGLPVWIGSSRHIVGVAKWDVTVEDALHACGAVLYVILSPDAVASSSVMDEVSFTIESGLKDTSSCLQAVRDSVSLATTSALGLHIQLLDWPARAYRCV